MVHTIDLDYLGTPGAIAVYLVEGPDGPALVEAGPANCIDALERGLAAHGYALGDIPDVLVTHIHFDHAGAAGHLAAHGATIHVHAFGAPHLVDPERLMKSAGRIYGERLEPLWGLLRASPAERVHAIADGDVVEAGGVSFRAIETPGHAKHHHAFAIEDDDGRACFTGDAAATYIRECPEFISVPMPPPEFDLEAWLASLDRLDAEGFDRIYPTHFGPMDDPRAHFARVRVALKRHADAIHGWMAKDLDDEAMRKAYLAFFLDDAARHHAPIEKLGFYVKDTMVGMNLTGVKRYWRKREEARS